MKNKILIVIGVLAVLVSTVHAWTIEHKVLGPNTCTQQFDRLVCDPGCAPQVLLTFKCCSTLSGGQCCQRLCYNVICVPEQGGPPSCAGSANGNANSLGNIFSGPCHSDGLCDGTPPSWQGPIPPDID